MYFWTPLSAQKHHGKIYSQHVYTSMHFAHWTIKILFVNLSGKIFQKKFFIQKCKI